MVTLASCAAAIKAMRACSCAVLLSIAAKQISWAAQNAFPDVTGHRVVNSANAARVFETLTKPVPGVSCRNTFSVQTVDVICLRSLHGGVQD